ncbi:hypothetical protein JQK15_05580 [Sphingobium sp. BHU LFT2]|uniref:hypothetical protein n=1 Tax=Sphingobium sp. BHU LFT2 TaxID=2807634 RepID=UPI001BE52661|nr:hypothetical protein [Sphingobium sp. BHU LFT2]MBT2243003.1 hypothetical protein [Sphingobium sp. BHU LFT2]
MQSLIPDDFFHLRPDYSISCGSTGYYLSYRGGRDGDTLLICHETKLISSNANPLCRILCFCSQSVRLMTDEESKRYRTAHTSIILWAVSGGFDSNTEIEGLWNARDFLKKYFDYRANLYAPVDAVSGKKKQVIVEVAFGTAGYGVNH